MARINIEDSILKDDRFTDLCIKTGSRIMALGIVCEAFILGQRYFLNEESGRFIPLNEWKRKEALGLLIDVGLAEVRELGVYIKGSEKHFAWLLQKQNAGKRGGRPNQNKQQEKKADALSRKAEESGEKPPYSFLLPPSSFLLSQALAPEDKYMAQKTKKPANRKLGAEVVGAYCDAWKLRYGTSPHIQPKDAKHLKSFAESAGLAKAKTMIGAFLTMTESWFITKRHDIPTFLNNLNAVTQFMENGRNLTSADVKTIDSANNLENTLRSIRENGI